jgi:predicted nucleic acid-binding protein
MKLIDSDILIDFSRKYSNATDFMKELEEAEDGFFISIITEMELLVGCRNKSELRATKKFLAEFKVIHISEVVSQKALELLEKFNLSHNLLIPDALIAATALINNFELATKNIKHFKMIPELKLIKPY